MKSILLSVRPEWVAKILNGEKTTEIRKTAPKEWTDYLFVNPKAKPEPMDVYIYCTDSKDYLLDKDENYFLWDKHIHHYLYEYEDEPKEHYFQRKVVAKFVLREMEAFYYFDDELCRRACLDREQMADYLGDKLGYAWHISDLVIFDEPKELDQFDYLNPSGTRNVGQRELNGKKSKKHPPQSWCYVEIKCGE